MHITNDGVYFTMGGIFIFFILLGAYHGWLHAANRKLTKQNEELKAKDYLRRMKDKENGE